MSVVTYIGPGLYQRADGSYGGFAFNANVIVDNIHIITENGSLKSVQATGFYSQWQGTGATWGGRNITIKIKNISGTEIASISTGETGNIVLTPSTIVSLPCRFSIDMNGTTNTAGGASVVTVYYSGEWKVYKCNSNTDFVFADSSNYQTMLLLPPVTGYPVTKLFFIKDSKFNASNKPISLALEENVTIDGQPSFRINSNGGCATIFSNDSRWYIANYYPSPIQGSLPTTNSSITNPNRIANASSNTINNFRTSGNDTSTIDTDRQSGNNLCTLPALDGTPKMCIVVYSGNNAGGRHNSGSGNVLAFSHSQYIDQNSNYSSGTGNKAYIYSNENMKNTGIVFISDGVFWYIAGWYNGSNWATSDTPTTSHTENALVDLNSHTIDLIGGTGNGIVYRLPQNTPTTPPYLLIVKARNDAAMMEFKTITPGSSANIVINEDIRNMYFNTARNNLCIWFVRQLSSSGFIRYFPIISYTPSA
jgi:hypothetical protein